VTKHAPFFDTLDIFIHGRFVGIFFLLLLSNSPRAPEGYPFYMGAWYSQDIGYIYDYIYYTKILKYHII